MYVACLNGLKDRVNLYEMKAIVRFVVVIILLNIVAQPTLGGVQHLMQSDAKCFPYDFVYSLEESTFVRLLVVPLLNKESLQDLSKLKTAPDTNPRYNEFLSCMWKDRGFQNDYGTINFQAVENALASAIGNEVGSTGPGLQLSENEARRIVGECSRLGGLTHGQKVMLVRNCILVRIKKITSN